MRNDLNPPIHFTLSGGPLDGQLVKVYLTEDQPELPEVILAFAPATDTASLDYPRTDGHFYRLGGVGYFYDDRLHAVPVVRARQLDTPRT